MLAQNFMSHTMLDITEPERDALVKVLGMLERGECQGFDMRTSFDWCGTPCCIRGWAITQMGGRRHGTRGCFSTFTLPPDLRDLFYPANRAYGVKDQSVAAMALRNYLTAGEARWNEVLAAL